MGHWQPSSWLFLLLLLTLQTTFWLDSTILIVAADQQEDLYKILGVSRTATTKEIKSAYRRKALDTHPDKNKGVPKEEAAAAFHKVVEAFETLSDVKSRKQYDRTGRTSEQQQQHQGFGGGRQQFRWSWSSSSSGRRRRSIQFKDRFDVKEAMSRVMHIVSLEQLKTVMLDENDCLERNLLMVFVTPQQVETLTDDVVCFPYPFAAKSTQGIWWEDVLQTVKVRFNNANDLTRFFGVPHGDELRSTGQPIFLFGRRGKELAPSNFATYSTNNRKDFESWVWKQLEVKVRFVNRHTHPVELYWIHNRSGRLLATLQPGEARREITMLSHEFCVRDARVDTRRDAPSRTRLSENSKLASWKILSDEHLQELVIPPTVCFDMSGHCPFWYKYGECRKNPRFMAEACKLTCGFCDESDNEKFRHEQLHSEGSSSSHDEDDGMRDEL